MLPKALSHVFVFAHKEPFNKTVSVLKIRYTKYSLLHFKFSLLLRRSDPVAYISANLAAKKIDHSFVILREVVLVNEKLF